MQGMVHVHVTTEVPIRARALAFADRVEIRFGKAFPVALLVDRDAVDRLRQALKDGMDALVAADEQPGKV
ncbi:hypothetical protein [Saccharopolyspora phatthalungensis]|uniref:Uncharacterized protein n=1 Tax=Saccharopolyspora phatthalungensis TaxID=664693 RepID=A0A840QC40_9PSEU|nr:hypothetical protein [Saccharopolyspora phatthalungensis]MBB5154443.1 hypothetical protein [Saccharopolyspora phatthalungensis]